MPEAQYFCTFWVLVETIEMSLRSTLVVFLSVRPSVRPSVRLSVIATKMSARFPTPEICICVCPATEGSTEFIFRFSFLLLCVRPKGAPNCSVSAASYVFESAATVRNELSPRNALSAHPRMPEARYFCKFWVLVETIEMSLRSTLVHLD